MDKRLRSSLQISADEFLKSATKLGIKSTKSSIKALIHSLTSNSPIILSLPLSLHQSISQSLDKLKLLSDSSSSAADVTQTPQSPPTKRLRRSSRIRQNDDYSGTKENNNNNKDNNSNREDVKRIVVENLQIYAYVVVTCVTHPKKLFSPLQLLSSARELHDNLILCEYDSVLMVEIANLCEEWWKLGLPGRETLIAQMIPVLLSRSLTLRRKVDVHRVYSIREAFTLFDFEDASIDDLRLLLIRCLIAPLYLKTEEGKKFVAFMFGLSGQLVRDALAMIRSQIPFGRKSMLEAYAEIVFRAWKIANCESREDIENGFLRGLVEGAIYASSVSLAASVRRVLGGFVSQRTTGGVEKLLFRITEPVIFRAAQASNSNVRQNTLHLLLDLFPLEDPDATKEGKDILLDKQFFLLEKLLADECPAVRVVAVEGSCRLLNLFWEIITSSTITKFLTKVFDEMIHDTSKDVRLSTVHGIIYLLGNPQSHEILKVLLPRLGHLISDSSLSVRAATVDLLLLLSNVRNIQFHKVVCLDKLLSTLANDQQLVAQKITKLLMPSYFPLSMAPEAACARCVTLIKRSPKAGERFCEFVLSEGASQQSLVKLLKVLIRLVLLPEQLEANEIDALLCASACICNNLASEPSCNASLKQELTGEKLKRLFAVSSTRRAQSYVCNIASTISPDGVDSCIEECMDLVTNCTGLLDNVEQQAEVRCAHKMMLSCDCFSYMFETLARILQKTADACYHQFGVEKLKHNFPSRKPGNTRSSIKISAKTKQNIRKRSFNSSTSIEEDYIIAAGIGWQIKELLKSEEARKAMLVSGYLEIVFFSFKVIAEVSILQSKQCDHVVTATVSAYTALALHISFEPVTFNIISNQTAKAKECSDRPSSEQTLLNQTMDHLLSCSSKLIGIAADSAKSSNLPQESRQIYKRVHLGGQKNRGFQADVSSSSHGGTQMKKLSNMLKMLTAVLKFVVDVSTRGLVSQTRCLNFTVEYLEFIISSLRRQNQCHLQCQNDDLKEMFLCVKRSFTYATKLLNLVLKVSTSEISPPLREAYILSNKLLDLNTCVEEHMGSKYATQVVAAAKPWLPDLIVGLGPWNILKQCPSESAGYFGIDQKSRFPSWPMILAKVELIENGLESADGVKSEKFPVFREMMGIVVQLLRANLDVLDAVGVIFLTGTIVGLERKDFQLVWGLLHFVCTKLVGRNYRDWRELKMMLESLEGIYTQLETDSEVLNNGTGQQILQSAKELLKPIWTSHLSETGRNATEEE